MPFIISQHGLGLVRIPFPELLGTATFAGMLPGAYLGPLGAAFVVTALSEGRTGLRHWTGRLLRWGVNWRWYALALLGVPALLALGTLAVSPGSAAGLRLPSLEVLLVYVPILLLQMVTTGQLLARRKHNEGLVSLTPRERDVLALVAEGRTNAAVAKRLFVTGGAVEKHVKSIFAKLGLPQGEADHRRVLAVLAHLRG